MSGTIRWLSANDAASVARIYNAAVAKRLATFDDLPSSVASIEESLRGDLLTHPGVAVVIGSALVGYATSSPHSTYEPYRGIAEFSVYVDEEYRGRGFGRLALFELVRRCEAAGFTKMISRILVDNAASRGLCASLGFREVGIYERHARLDGAWRDVVIVEKLLEKT